VDLRRLPFEGHRRDRRRDRRRFGGRPLEFDFELRLDRGRMPEPLLKSLEAHFDAAQLDEQGRHGPEQQEEQQFHHGPD